MNNNHKTGDTTSHQSKCVTWSIRGVDRNTRLVIEKAAERVGKTLGKYLNEDLTSFAQWQLSQPDPSKGIQDVQSQIEQLAKKVEDMATRLTEKGKKTFWQRLFG